MFKPAFAAVLVASCCTVAAEDIEHISIYANRTATPEQDVLASVTVLERDDIVARQASDLPSLLNQLAGISVAREGGRGQSSGLFVRGGETGHTLLLVDGVRTGSATLGYKSLAMLPLELIERIEIIRGPRAAWYGSDALAGVIAITTRRSQAVELTAGVGSHGQASIDMSVSHRINDLTLRATTGVSRADGINVQEGLDPDRDGYNQKFIKLAADYQTAVGLWTAQFDVNSGFYQFDTAWGTEDQADTLNRSYLLGWQLQLGQWQHQAQLSRILDNDATFGPDSRSPFTTERDEFNYQASFSANDQLTVLGGVNWYQEQVEKTAPNYEQDSRTNRALFVGLDYQIAGWQLEATGRRDHVSQYGGENTWQLAAGYQLAEHWLIRASRGTAFKAPTFNDLYWPEYGNPLLKPQQSLSDELAIRYHDTALQAELVWFDRDVTNLIQGVTQAENVLLAEIKGIEFTLQQQWQQFGYAFAYTWLEPLNRVSGTKLLRRPENSLNWRGSYNADNWSAFVTADYQSRTAQGFNWDTFSDNPDAPAFTLWGIGSSYTVTPALTLRAKVDNLFDKNYHTVAGYHTPGITFGLSLSYIPQ